MQDNAQPAGAGGERAEEPRGKAEIPFETFMALDLRTAKVLAVEKHPNADKLLVLKIDLGPLGERQIVAGLAPYYTAEEIVGKTIIIVANLKPVRLRGIESRGMLLAVTDGDRVVLLTTLAEVAAGCAIS